MDIQAGLPRNFQLDSCGPGIDANHPIRARDADLQFDAISRLKVPHAHLVGVRTAPQSDPHALRNDTRLDFFSLPGLHLHPGVIRLDAQVRLAVQRERLRPLLRPDGNGKYRQQQNKTSTDLPRHVSSSEPEGASPLEFTYPTA